MSINKRLLILLIPLLAVLIVGYIFLYNYLNSAGLTVTGKNITSYEVRSGDNILHTSSSGDTTTFRVPKHSSVSIDYKGASYYTNGVQEVAIKDTATSVTINPYFSREHLMSLVGQNRLAIDDAIFSYKSDIRSQYSLGSHTLHHFGDWASVNLTWKGEYDSNSDNLKVILRKHNDTWEVAGQPSLLFYYKNYPDIPIDILEVVNNS